MLKKATHDSASGEASANILSMLMIPFARTQSKTIKGQYNAGCRSFDIRVRRYKGEWHCAHGLFITKRTALEIFEEIDSFSARCQVCVTYEGGMEENDAFITFVTAMRAAFTNIIWGYAAVKYGTDARGVKVKYTKLLESTPDFEGGVQGFLPLDGRSWHTFVPIPRLWDKLYKRPHKFNADYFTYVDFL